MAGTIYYRARVKAKKGAKSTRYRIIAVSDINLNVYAEHFRKTELEQIAAATGATLVPMERGEKHK